MRVRPADALEGLDDEHARAAARTWAWMHGRGLDCRIGFTAQIVVGGIDGLHTQQSAGFGEVLLALSVGEQAVVADAVQAFRQHVDKEPTYPSSSMISSL